MLGRNRIKWEASHPEDANEPSRLLSLSPELRIMVLEEVLVVTGLLCHSDNAAYLDRLSARNSEYALDNLPATAITRVDTGIMASCRQLHAESAHIFFTRNTFVLDDKADVQGHVFYRIVMAPKIALPVMPRCCLRLIKHVAVSVPNLEDWHLTVLRVCVCLVKLPDVQSLTVLAEAAAASYLPEVPTDKAVRDEEVQKMIKQVKKDFGYEWVRVPKALRVTVKGPEPWEQKLKAYSLMLNEAMELAKTLRNCRY